MAEKTTPDIEWDRLPVESVEEIADAALRRLNYAGGLRGIVRQPTTVIARLLEGAGPVRRALEEHRGRGPLKGTDALALGHFFLWAFHLLCLARQDLESWLDRGAEGGAFRDACAEYLGAAEDYLALLAGVRGLKVEGPPGDLWPPFGGMGRHFEQEAEALREYAARLLQWASAPPGPVDWKAVEESRAAYDRGDYERAEDIVARLRSGGDL